MNQVESAIVLIESLPEDFRPVELVGVPEIMAHYGIPLNASRNETLAALKDATTHSPQPVPRARPAAQPEEQDLAALTDDELSDRIVELESDDITICLEFEFSREMHYTERAKGREDAELGLADLTSEAEDFCRERGCPFRLSYYLESATFVRRHCNPEDNGDWTSDEDCCSGRTELDGHDVDYDESDCDLDGKVDMLRALYAERDRRGL
jgi:hypothetical protein